ncbi:Rad51 [Taphrina deformans PYCC 5710]|uniref:Rad51 n=1 Tax=Taphrina deformans (strain PYCC 5710 / ATCC 11124 / CBS 356.35 / IMI 108563 / JCM 9778 / NBRC 8474) TaxID=1097556 RepID=R5A1M3_TAPDE|nr:Rad51 [Taphrina deformans PYCC 5710]|eukprot:CCX35412.1 Rad51 [Taphrina deformans PYCC 5710]
MITYTYRAKVVRKLLKRGLLVCPDTRDAFQKVAGLALEEQRPCPSDIGSHLQAQATISHRH